MTRRGILTDKYNSWSKPHREWPSWVTYSYSYADILGQYLIKAVHLPFIRQLLQHWAQNSELRSEYVYVALEPKPPALCSTFPRVLESFLFGLLYTKGSCFISSISKFPFLKYQSERDGIDFIFWKIVICLHAYEQILSLFSNILITSKPPLSGNACFSS